MVESEYKIKFYSSDILSIDNTNFSEIKQNLKKKYKKQYFYRVFELLIFFTGLFFLASFFDFNQIILFCIILLCFYIFICILYGITKYLKYGEQVDELKDTINNAIEDFQIKKRNREYIKDVQAILEKQALNKLSDQELIDHLDQYSVYYNIVIIERIQVRYVPNSTNHFEQKSFIFGIMQKNLTRYNK